VASTARISRPGELQEWVNAHCRFTPDAVQLEEDFPETAVLLEAAHETGTQTVYITDGFMVSRGARDVNEKTIPERSWERADGEQGSKTCDRAVVGIYADGDRRGEAIGVCIARTSCTVHWPAEVKARQAREAKRAKSGAAPAKAKKPAALTAYTPEQITQKRLVSLRLAAVKPVEQLLAHAHLKPSRKLVAAARAWVAKEAGVTGSLNAEQLLVALFVESFGDVLEWKLRERPQTLAVFGVDAILKTVTVDTCLYCGCSQENGCRLGEDTHYRAITCKWISKTPLVCSNPICRAQFEKGSVFGAAAVAPAKAPKPKRAKITPVTAAKATAKRAALFPGAATKDGVFVLDEDDEEGDGNED